MTHLVQNNQKNRTNRQSKKKKINWYAIGLSLLVVVFLGTLIWKTQTMGPSQQASPVAPIDGIRCESMEGNALHEHSHLAIYNNGQSVEVPANIGIPQNLCMYWVHTHDNTGVIHMESPEKRAFTLGNFFNIWGQPLASDKVLTYTDGKPLKMYVDGKPFTGDPNTIEMKRHTQIVLEVGPNYVDPPSFTFPEGE